MAIDRRTFIVGASGAAAAARGGAATAGAARRGSIADVEHVVILMQENRSFDHYFGMLRGVRGFADPRPVTLPSGQPVWNQRAPDREEGRVVRPFRLDYNSSNARCFTGLDHSWKDSQHRWANWDVWVEQKGPLTMAHLTREDIPFYYALADQFTICDAYHCSVQGPTGPNRLFHFSGTNGLSVGLEGEYCVTNGGCDDNPCADMARDDPRFAGLPWRSYAGRLEEAGISWRVYQEYANYSDNPLGYFKEFRNLDKSSSHYRRGRAFVDWKDGVRPADPEKTRAEHLIAAFAADVAADRLPAVSWIVPMMAMSEHPDAPVPYGEVLTASLIRALAANPKVWAKTAFILNYDENDGFFDHVPPPMPGIAARYGASNVDVRGETYQGQPLGLGPRVPMIVVSPWTRGGWVNSQMFDHTSVLRFLERRFGVMEPNISPWRRSICGDLTSIFDFDVSPRERADVRWAANLPSVAAYVAETDRLCRAAPPPRIGRATDLPQPEPGTRPARALPYSFAVDPVWSEAELTLRFVNDGPTGIVFGVQDAQVYDGWRYFTVAAGTTLTESWPADPALGHALVVKGPNGFHRDYRRAADGARFETALIADAEGATPRIELRNRDAAPLGVEVRCAHGGARRSETVPGLGKAVLPLPRGEGHRWYDILVSAGDGAWQRLAGHVENGMPDISEPAPAFPHRA